MRTSEEIYHRVRWDPRFDPARFVLGINVRGLAPKRVPLPAFVPGGDIPWHRVLFIEADGEVLWDRAEGVDRIDSSTAGRIRKPRRLPAQFFEPRTFGAASSTSDTLRVLTWNTLWDRYDSDRIDTAHRWPLLLAALAGADADVIALQEVERPLLKLLRELDYATGDDNVDDSGVILLSRLPIDEAGTMVLGPHKAATAITVDCGGVPVVVVNVHLTSDHTPGGAQRRDAELVRLDEALSTVDAQVLVVGDVNDGGDTAVRALRLRDAWSEVHGPADDTVTFDPGRNPLAAVSSLTGRASRLDRILVRPGALRPVAARLIGAEPVGGLFPSDHFGVIVDLNRSPVRADAVDRPPTARTALAWLPPADGSLTPPSDRWPPHVNVLFGFVPEDAFAEAATAATVDLAPFPVRLVESGTDWLVPADGEPWQALRHALSARFPQCRGRIDGYTPHLSLGGPAKPVSAMVSELTLLSRRGDEPMRPRAVVGLGTGEIRWIPDPPVEVGSPVDTSALERRLAAVLPDAVLHVVGSRRLGCALSGADLDLVAAVPGQPTIESIRDRVGTVASPVRVVSGARVPGLRFRARGVDVDLVVVNTGSVPAAEAVARRAELGDAAAIALSAVSDAEALSGVVPVELARTVKAWARTRGLDSAPFGGVPGIGWLVLAAHAPDDFFGHWAAWDWRQPVGGSGPDAAMTVLTPSSPVRSCTEQVSAGLRDLMVEELYHTWEGRPAVPPHRRHAAWAVLSVGSVPGEAAEVTLGRFRGRVRTLIAELERDAVGVHAWPRPFEPGRYAIGLGRDPYDAPTLARLSADWLRTVPGVTIERVDGGSVPTLV